jgi:ArsR family transcriptional regulator
MPIYPESQSEGEFPEGCPRAEGCPAQTEGSDDAIHKALASPVRRAILAWLKEPQDSFGNQAHPLAQGVCAGQIEARCGLAQSTVSGHLAALQHAGLITSRPVGQWIFFTRNEAAIEAFLARLATDL